MARILLAVHNVFTEHVSGAARSMRTIMRWLRDSGHHVFALSTGRFESTRGATLDAHLASLGIAVTWRNMETACPDGTYIADGIPVRVLATAHNDMKHPDAAENARYLTLFDEILRRDVPDVVLSYGAHPVLHEALRRARLAGARTVFSARGHGYEQAGWYRHADHVLATSPFMAREIQRHAGVEAIGIPSPIDWEETVGTEETRGFRDIHQSVVIERAYAVRPAGGYVGPAAAGHSSSGRAVHRRRWGVEANHGSEPGPV